MSTLHNRLFTGPSNNIEITEDDSIDFNDDEDDVESFDEMSKCWVFQESLSRESIFPRFQGCRHLEIWP